jgi:tetratricopeptide (TPR) repeat protein
MRRISKSLLTAFALMVTPAVAFAEEPTKSYPDCGREPTDAEVAAAKGAFQAGNASFNEADYARAIDYWEDAYRRDCTANPLLLNLARAYELAGRKRQAVVALETFLSREPSSGEKDQINRRIEVLKKKIADEDAAAAAAPPPTTGPATGPATGATTGPAAGPEPAERASRSPGPWIVIGLGGAAAVVGTIGLVSNKKKLDDADALCGGNRKQCTNSQAVSDGNEARSAMNVSGALAGIGVAAVGVGVIWYVVDGKRVANANGTAATDWKRPRFTPVVGPQVAGFTLSGAF